MHLQVEFATIQWGEKWHTPGVKEWNHLVEKCDYERKEVNESGYDVAGYFFYNKKDHSKFIFLPISLWSDELEYWTSETGKPLNGSSAAYTFHSSNGKVSCTSTADINNTGFAIRPVFVE